MNNEEFLHTFPQSIKSKADALQYALETTNFDFEKAKDIFKFFCDNVNLPDVADSGYYVGRLKNVADNMRISEETAKEMCKVMEESCRVFDKQKEQTYDDVARELFESTDESAIFFKPTGCNGELAVSTQSPIYSSCDNTLNCTSCKQAEKLLAINKLLNVARFLNGEWKPDWDDASEPKFSFFIGSENDMEIAAEYDKLHHLVYFRTKKLAQRAIDILGEDTIRLALSTDY